MRRAVKISAWALAASVLLVAALLGTVWIAGNTDPGRAWIERLTYRLTSGYVKLSGLGGSFPTQLTLDRLELTDGRGVWLTACDAKTSELVPMEGRQLLRAAMMHLSGRLWANRFDSPGFRSLLRWIEWLVLPGICTHDVVPPGPADARAQPAHGEVGVG